MAGLVLGVRDMFHLSGPAASTAAAYVALLGCGAVASGVYDRGPMSPGVTGCGVVLCIR